MLTLYARDGWGSVLIEAQLDWYGLEYQREEVGDLLGSAEARAALVHINPVAQVPTLLLPGGEVLTESAAITLYLAELTHRTDFVPAPAEPTRARSVAVRCRGGGPGPLPCGRGRLCAAAVAYR